MQQQPSETLPVMLTYIPLHLPFLKDKITSQPLQN